MKKKIVYATLCSLLFLSACTRPLAGNKNTTEEEPVVTQSTGTGTTTTTTTTKVPETYDLKKSILNQVNGEVGEKFLYLSEHLTDTKVNLESVYHGCFTQTQNSELLLVYEVENAPESNGNNPTFLFILNTMTGELETSHFFTADEVNLYLLPSPIGNKIFVTQTTLTSEGVAGAASIYSCMAGVWSKSSAVSSFSTVSSTSEEGQEILSTDYIYTFNGETLTIESQTIEHGVSSMEYVGLYTWNSDLAIFTNN